MRFVADVLWFDNVNWVIHWGRCVCVCDVRGTARFMQSLKSAFNRQCKLKILKASVSFGIARAVCVRRVFVPWCWQEMCTKSNTIAARFLVYICIYKSIYVCVCVFFNAASRT